MSTKFITKPLLWKRGYTDAYADYVGPDGELTLDCRNNVIELSLHDTTTPGGIPQVAEPEWGVKRPTITSPIDGSIDLTLAPTFTTGAFVGIYDDAGVATRDVHVSTSLQIATDVNFTNIVLDLPNYTDDLYTIDLSVAVATELPHSSLLYARVSYTGVSGNTSPWSPTVSFNTIVVLEYAYNTAFEAGDLAADMYYGISVAISGNGLIMAVGAPGRTSNGVTGAGGVYIYMRANTSQIFTYRQTLYLDTPDVNGWFGRGVALDGTGEWLIVGAPFQNTNGMVYSYHLGSVGYYFQITNIIAYDNTNPDGSSPAFGWSVAITADASKVAIGAGNGEVSGSNSGKVYIMGRAGVGIYTEQYQVTPPAAIAGMSYANGINFNDNGSILMVGAPRETISGATDAGAAYVYNATGAYSYAFDTKLTEPVPTASNLYGYDVSVSGSLAHEMFAVGAPQKGSGGQFQSGGVYMYETLLDNPKDVAAVPIVAGSGFGASLDHDSGGNILLVGSPLRDVAGQHWAGRVSLYNTI